MLFNQENYLNEYFDFSKKIINESLKNDVYHHTSSTYLFAMIVSTFLDFEKLYAKKYNVYEIYRQNPKLKAEVDQYQNYTIEILMNFFHNKRDFSTNSLINSNYFKDLKKSFNFDKHLELREIINASEHLDHKLIKHCNKILQEDTLKTKDIYSIRNELQKELDAIIVEDNIPLNVYQIILNKLDNICKDCLEIFERENVQHKQIFEYISIHNTLDNEYIFYIEKEYKNQILSQLLKFKLNDALQILEQLTDEFKNNFEDLDYQVIAFKKHACITNIEKFYYKNIVNFDDLDL